VPGYLSVIVGRLGFFSSATIVRNVIAAPVVTPANDSLTDSVQTLTIHGINFGILPNGATVNLTPQPPGGGLICPIQTIADDQIVCIPTPRDAIVASSPLYVSITRLSLSSTPVQIATIIPTISLLNAAVYAETVDTIVIDGANFGSDPGAVTVDLSPAGQCTVTRVTDSEITCHVTGLNRELSVLVNATISIGPTVTSATVAILVPRTSIIGLPELSPL